MNFDKSTQRTRWLQEQQTTTNNDKEDNNNMEVVEDITKSLVVRQCVVYLNFFGDSLTIRREVILTAMVYVRRYYHTQPLVDDPLLIILTALYLAGKVEEEKPNSQNKLDLDQRGIDIRGLVKLVWEKRRDKSGDTEESFLAKVIRNEMELLVGINFDLLCFHPYKPAIGYMEKLMEEKKNVLSHSEEEFREEVWKKSIGCYLVDELMFNYPPGLLGVVSLFCAAKTLQESEEVLECIISIASTISQKKTCRDLILSVSADLESGLTEEIRKEARLAFQNFTKKS